MSKSIILPISVLAALLVSFAAFSETEPIQAEVSVSEESEACIDCHQYYTPGIVADWRDSRHSHTAPGAALAKPEAERRISAEEVPEELAGVAVGCYECHSRRLEQHRDSFEHEGYEINVIVSPEDCATCHPRERDEFAGSKKAHAVGNLLNNDVYKLLVDTLVSVKEVKRDGIAQLEATDNARGETCLACHGTVVEVAGMKTVVSEYGTLDVPDLRNWPNQGVGRVNPDGSMGSCAACHARHAFSIATARKPYTCLECHLNPDVPGWEVWRESKHGNLFLSSADKWDFDSVPWKPGEHFSAPTCAVCHVSQLAGFEGDIIVERSHDFGARLWVRIFGLVYSHPQPKKGDTSIIRNADDMPLPITFTAVPAEDYLIDEQEQGRRKGEMKRVCTACHSSSWSDGHFDQLDATITESDKMVVAATKLMVSAWQNGLAASENPFDEAIEQKWVSQWLFYANSVRYGSAMGGPDYSSFKNGWFYLSNTLQEMKDSIALKSATKPKTEK